MLLGIELAVEDVLNDSLLVNHKRYTARDQEKRVRYAVRFSYQTSLVAQ